MTRRPVLHSASAMFDLVADVERYPEFVPLCESLAVRSRVPLDDGRERIIARMGVGYGPIREAFVSNVILDRANGVIQVSYVDGPFRALENRWTFRDGQTGQGSVVEFFIAYEFKSLPLQILMGAMFDKAFRKFTTAFEARADDIYGRPQGASDRQAPLAGLPA